jgi:hypothetical protein
MWLTHIAGLSQFAHAERPPHDIPVLMAARLFKPLGNPQQNSAKYFAAIEIQELAKDRAWLARTANAFNQRWQRKNGAKKNAVSTELQPLPEAVFQINES